MLSQSIHIIKNANTITIELHNAKEEVNRILSKFNFHFTPISKRIIYCHLFMNLILHQELNLDLIGGWKVKIPICFHKRQNVQNIRQIKICYMELIKGINDIKTIKLISRRNSVFISMSVQKKQWTCGRIPCR